MRVVLLGCPGSGKGTQAQFLCARYAIPQIATGNILRHEVSIKSHLGAQAKQIMAAGQLVPDELILSIIEQRLSQSDCAHGYLLDGFPRTLAQAEALSQMGQQLNHVVNLAIDDAAVVQRLSGRRVHPASDRVYHVDFNPPKIPETDDETGDPLVHRQDDRPEVIIKRLAVYHQQTEPLVQYYQKLAGASAVQYHTVKADRRPEEVRDTLFGILDTV